MATSPPHNCVTKTLAFIPPLDKLLVAAQTPHLVVLDQLLVAGHPVVAQAVAARLILAASYLDLREWRIQQRGQ